MDILWTKKVPTKPGIYLHKKKNQIGVMNITVKDLEVEKEYGGWLSDMDFWSKEVIKEHYL